jgi:preprotein translocase subunit SecG
MEIALGILLIVLAVILVVCVLMQSGKGKKLSSTITGSSDTFFSKGKAQSKDKILSRVTTILAVVFILLTLVTVIVITVLV